jgi:hypothetical protein
VVVNDFDVDWSFVRPAKHDAPLIVDANAATAFAISGQMLETVGRPGGKVRQ